MQAELAFYMECPGVKGRSVLGKPNVIGTQGAFRQMGALQRCSQAPACQTKDMDKKDGPQKITEESKEV